MVKEKTLCWECGNAGKCSWGEKQIPVEGWKAKRHKVRCDYGDYYAYTVSECPEYKPFEKIIVHDEGIKYLREAIVRQMGKDYRNAVLKTRRNDPAYKTKQIIMKPYRRIYRLAIPPAIKRLEAWIRDDENIILGGLDPEAIIRELRKENELD